MELQRGYRRGGPHRGGGVGSNAGGILCTADICSARHARHGVLCTGGQGAPSRWFVSTRPGNAPRQTARQHGQCRNAPTDVPEWRRRAGVHGIRLPPVLADVGERRRTGRCSNLVASHCAVDDFQSSTERRRHHRIRSAVGLGECLRRFRIWSRLLGVVESCARQGAWFGW